MMVSLVSLSESLKHFPKTVYFYQLQYFSKIILNFIKHHKVETSLFPFRFFRLALKSSVKTFFS